MPQNCEEESPSYPYQASDEKRIKLNKIIPENPNQPYDIREVINEAIDARILFWKCIKILLKILLLVLHALPEKALALLPISHASCRCIGYSCINKSSTLCSLLRLL